MEDVLYNAVMYGSYIPIPFEKGRKYGFQGLLINHMYMYIARAMNSTRPFKMSAVKNIIFITRT